MVRPTQRLGLAIGLALALASIVGVRFALPIEDGDIFWHMAYGAQMIERRTLQLDHTPFSWMPASNEMIYCAWIGELLFRLLWTQFGLMAVFVLRYVIVVIVLGLLATHAWRRGVLRQPATWVVLLLTTLGSVVATFPKPEMLSLMLWHVLVFCWFGLLDAQERGRAVLPWLYTTPALMLVWVNTHGAFILAAPFVVITAAATLARMPHRAAHIMAAAALCGLAILTNPYGSAYPAQLLTETLRFTARPDLADNNAYMTTFASGGEYYHLPELLLWMIALLAFVSRQRPNGWHITLLLCCVYMPLYLIYIRASFLLPALAGYGVIHLSRTVAWPRVTPALACAAFVFLGGRAIAQAVLYPETGAWVGFGIGTTQPVEEAEFLARGDYGSRIYNTYNAGGYLIWRLYPRYQVMVDARSFPYLDWYAELREFTRSSDPAVFRAFLDRHPADVALVDFQEGQVWRSFLKTPGWRPAYYGPNAAVFVRSATARAEAAPSLTHLRNGRDAALIFDFATAVGDYPTAWTVLAQVEGPLVRQTNPADVQRMVTYRDGHRALQAGAYDRAWDAFAVSLRQHQIDGQDNTILLLLKALQQLTPEDPRAATIRDALSRLAG